MTTLAEALAVALRNLRDEQRAVYYAHDIDSQVFTDLLTDPAVRQALAAMVAPLNEALDSATRLLSEAVLAVGGRIEIPLKQRVLADSIRLTVREDRQYFLTIIEALASPDAAPEDAS